MPRPALTLTGGGIWYGTGVTEPGAVGRPQRLREHTAKRPALQQPGIYAPADESSQSESLNGEILRAKLEQSYAIADLNSDGLPDVVFADFLNDTLSVKLADGQGHFLPESKLFSGRGPRALAAADFNNDGTTDVAVANFFSGGVAIFLGFGDGSFHDPLQVTLDVGLTSMIRADFDFDGRQDLAVANFPSGELAILHGQGDGTFAVRIAGDRLRGCTLILEADMDRNGLPDLVAFNASSRRASLFANLGLGLFTAAESIPSETAISAVRGATPISSKASLLKDSFALQKVSGDGQSAPVGTLLPEALVVEISDSNDSSKVGRSAHFSNLIGDAVFKGDHVLYIEDRGQAALEMTLGSLPGSHLIAAGSSGERIAVFGAVSTLPVQQFLQRIRLKLIGLPLDRETITLQFSLLNQSLVHLINHDASSAVTRLGQGISLYIENVLPDLDDLDTYTTAIETLDLIKRLMNQILLLGAQATPEIASTISCGQTISGTISAPGQQDSYTFSANAGEAVQMAVDETSGSLTAEVELFDPSGTSIASTTGVSRSIKVPFTGSYTILVGDFIVGDTGSYSLGLVCIGPTCTLATTSSSTSTTTTTTTTTVTTSTTTTTTSSTSTTTTSTTTTSITTSTTTTTIPAGTAGRSLPTCYVAGSSVSVSIDVAPTQSTQVYAVEETPPSNWTVGNISDNGVFDTVSKKVKWGPFFDATARTLTYTATPPAGDLGQKSFSGTASFDGNSANIGGASTIDACMLHPADPNNDSRIVIGELTAYGAAWKNGQSWPTPPNPIPIDYVTRAGFLWRSGEIYHLDPNQSCPLCWVPGTAALVFESTGIAEIVPTSDTHVGEATRMYRVTNAGTGEIVVSISIVSGSATRAYGLEEMIPSDWKIRSISDGGRWDRKSQKVRWGPFFDNTHRKLTYKARPPAGFNGDKIFSGFASFDGSSVAVVTARAHQ